MIAEYKICIGCGVKFERPYRLGYKQWAKRQKCSKNCYKNNPSYSSLHKWVAAKLGRPQKCENCRTEESPKFEWANLSGDYLRDTSDWARLCHQCHTLIDHQGTKRHSYNLGNQFARKLTTATQWDEEMR